MPTSSVILSTFLQLTCTFLGSAVTAYAIYTHFKAPGVRIHIFPFIINLIASCLLICLTIAPSQAASILLAAQGSQQSNYCLIFLTLCKAIHAETYINLACLALWKAYLALTNNTTPLSVAFKGIIISVPWTVGVAYGIISSLWWCFDGDNRMVLEPRNACYASEIINGKVLSGASIRKIDNVFFLISLILQVLGSLTVIMAVKHKNEIIGPYHINDSLETPSTGVTKLVRLTEQRVSIDKNSLVQRRSSFTCPERSSRTRITRLMKKVSTHSDRSVHFHRSMSSHDFSLSSSLSTTNRRSRRLRRGLSDTDLINSIPGYIPDGSDGKQVKENVKEDNQGPVSDETPGRFVQRWKSLNPKPQTTSVDSSDMETSRKDSSGELKAGCLSDVKEPSERSFCARSLNSHRLSSNGTTASSLQPPRSHRSGSTHSFSTGLSSEALSAFSLGTPFTRSFTQNVPEAWTNESTGSNKKPSSSHDASTSTRDIEDLLLEHHQAEANHQDATNCTQEPPSTQDQLGHNSYTDAWRKMSSYSKSNMSNTFCENQDQLTTLEKIKQWRTASVDCSTVLTSELDEPAFFDLCFAPDMRDSISLENIRSVSQITAPNRATAPPGSQDQGSRAPPTIRSTTISKMSQTAYHISDGRSKKLIRMNSQSSIRVSQTAKNELEHEEQETQDVGHDLDSREVTHNICHEIRDDLEPAAQTGLSMRKTLVSFISKIFLFVLFHVPAISVDTYIGQYGVDEISYSVLLVFECFPFIWYAIAPIAYIIYVD